MANDSYHQNHSGSGNNIMNFGRLQFEMSDAMMADIASRLSGQRSVNLFAVGSAKSLAAVQRLSAFLSARGIAVTLNIIGVLSPPLADPVELRPDGIYVNADI